MLIRLNKPADQCTFIFSKFVKSKKRKEMQVNKKAGEISLFNQVFLAVQKKGRQAHALLCNLTQIYISLIICGLKYTEHRVVYIVSSVLLRN